MFMINESVLTRHLHSCGQSVNRKCIYKQLSLTTTEILQGCISLIQCEGNLWQKNMSYQKKAIA